MSTDSWGDGGDKNNKLRIEEQKALSRMIELGAARAARTERVEKTISLLKFVIVVAACGVLAKQYLVPAVNSWLNKGVAVDGSSVAQGPDTKAGVSSEKAGPSVPNPASSVAPLPTFGPDVPIETIRQICVKGATDGVQTVISNRACVVWADRDRESSIAKAKAQASAPTRQVVQVQEAPVVIQQRSVPSVDENEYRLEVADRKCDVYGVGQIQERRCRENLFSWLQNQCTSITSEFNMASGERRDYLREEREHVCYVYNHFHIIKT